jgi:replicative DNA helicase
MLRNASLIPSVVKKIKTEDFYREAHKMIFDAIVALDAGGKPVDPALVVNQLVTLGTLEKVGGESYLIDVMEKVPVPLNAVHYAGIVLDYSMRRALCMEGARIMQGATDMSTPSVDILTSFEKEVGECRSRLVAGERIDILELAKRVASQMEMYKSPEKRGLTTGYIDLDRLMGGIKKQHFIVIAGRPSMGKSSLAFNVSRNAVGLKKKVLIVTLEMSDEEVLYSMAISGAHVNSNRIRDGFATGEEIARVILSLGTLTEGFLWIEQPKTNDLYEIRALVKEHHGQHGLDLVVIDYLQMMEVASGAQKKRFDSNRQQEVATISRTVKMMTRELDVPIIGICQLNRGSEGRDDKRPRLSDLRDSGSLEQDADTVLLLYRDDYYNKDSPNPNVCEIEVSKNRSGRTGVVETLFLRDMLKFENLSSVAEGSFGQEGRFS